MVGLLNYAYDLIRNMDETAIILDLVPYKTVGIQVQTTTATLCCTLSVLTEENQGNNFQILKFKGQMRIIIYFMCKIPACWFQKLPTMYEASTRCEPSGIIATTQVKAWMER